MFCPNCGTNTSSDQKFCRGCGFNLAPVSQMLANGAVPQPQQSSPVLPEQSGSDRGRLLRWGFIAFWGGIVLAALLGIVGSAVSDVSHGLGDMIENLAGLGGLFVLIGIGIMVYSRLVPKTRQASPAFLPSPNPVNDPKVIGEPPQSIQAPVASVTEHTTYRLEPAKRNGS